MRAIVTSTHGGPDVLTITELPDPQPADGEVLIDIEAFGLNHAELYFRDGRWGDLQDAPVTGSECAGTVALDRSGRLAPGTKVVAITGGMGRTRNGTYAEKVTVPATNVVAVDTGLSWSDLVALPETYATAWTSLHPTLAVAPGQTILVRGATSALGQAVVNIAADLGAAVIATTRNPERRGLLFDLGAKDVLLDDGALATQAQAAGIVIDAAVDLVGSSALRDTLAAVRAGRPGVPGRFPRRLGTGRRLRPAGRPALRRSAELLRQLHVRLRALPAGRRAGARVDRQGRGRRLPGEAGPCLRLRRGTRGTQGHGGERGPRQDGGHRPLSGPPAAGNRRPSPSQPER